MIPKIASTSPVNTPSARPLWTISDPDPDVRVPWMWLVPLVAAAAVIRAIALNQQLWFDEIMTLVTFVRQPFSSLVTTYTSQNQHLLYSILAWASIQVFGDYPWTLRLPAVVFGVLSVPALYFAARQLTTRREAQWAAALIAVSYHHVWFSQNARGYTGILFFTLLATYFFVRASREGKRVLWIAYGVSVALGMYTHLSMAFITAAHGLVYLWLWTGRWAECKERPSEFLRSLTGFVVAVVLTLALYSPVLPQLFTQTLAPEGRPVRLEWSSPLWLLRETLRGLAGGRGAAGLAAVAAAGLIACAGLVSYWRENRFGVGLLVLPGVVTAVVMSALGHNLWPRLFFFSIGFAFLFLVRGVVVLSTAASGWLKSSERTALRLAHALLTVALLASMWMLRAAYLYPKQDFVGAMHAVETLRQDGEPIVTVGLTTAPYGRYYRRDWRAVETAAQLNALLSGGSRVWLLYTFPIQLRGKYPDIWHIIQSEFTTVRVFRGTIGDGEIVLCQSSKH